MTQHINYHNALKGQIVKFIEKTGYAARAGMLAEVTGFDERWLSVRWLDLTEQVDGRYDYESFEVVNLSYVDAGAMKLERDFRDIRKQFDNLQAKIQDYINDIKSAKSDNTKQFETIK
jgi:hypothetical protein